MGSGQRASGRAGTMRSRTNDATCARSVAWIGSYVSHVRILCPGEGEGTSAVSGWAIYIVHRCIAGRRAVGSVPVVLSRVELGPTAASPPPPPTHTRGGGGHCMGAQALTHCMGAQALTIREIN